MDDADRYRCRRIYLTQSDDSAYQAEAACDALANIEGILLAAPFSVHCIHIIYSIDKLTFEIVMDLLHELDFETDKSLLLSLRNTIFCFLEDNARDNMDIDVTEFQQDEPEDPESPSQQADLENADPAVQQSEEKYWDDYR
jgi:hypothetical protein